MSDDKSPQAMVIEAHEEFIQHIEAGSAKIRVLSIITVVAAVALLASYLYQLSLPYLSGTQTVTVSLADPALQATELALVALMLVWLYVGVRDFRFTSKMANRIKEARAAERAEEKKLES